MEEPVLVAFLSLTLTLAPPDSQATDQGPGYVNGVCHTSPTVKDRPPDDPNADTFASPGGTWYADRDRTIWAWWWGRRSDGSYKALWVRPKGSTLIVTGRRLDGPSSPLKADIARSNYTFETSGLTFPKPGCWEVNASDAGKTLRFVVAIP
jgi:hypothetical protein